MFVRLFKELRGGDYRVNGAADGSAVKKLLTWAEATDVEIERRMRAAFADPFFRNKRPTLAYFVSGWNGWQGAAVAPSPTATGTRYVPGENLYPDE